MNKMKIFLFMVLGVLLLTGFKNDAYADSVESQAGDIPISSIEFLDKNLDVKEVYSEDVLLNTVSNGIVTPMADDTRIETRLVTKYYDGRYTVDGQSYNYSLRVRVIYDCEISPGSIRMSGIRNIDSSAGDGAVFRTYNQTYSQTNSMSSSIATVSGTGRWTTPILPRATTYVDVKFKVTFNVNEGRLY